MSISLLHLSDLHLKEVDGDWCRKKSKKYSIYLPLTLILQPIYLFV